jgi:hypothetical protein
MSEDKGNSKGRRRIYSYFTRSRFLNVEDALRIGKIRIFVGRYELGNGASATAYHLLDLADARMLFNDLAWGKPIEGFDDFKGTPARDGKQAQSRVLKVNTKGKTTWVEVKNGPGKETGQGAIQPAGEPESDVSVPLSLREGRKLGLAVLAYVRAWENRHLIEATPVAPAMLRYGDGERADIRNAAEQAAFQAYVEQHDGTAPPSREVLRAWWRGNGDEGQ